MLAYRNAQNTINIFTHLGEKIAMLENTGTLKLFFFSQNY